MDGRDHLAFGLGERASVDVSGDPAAPPPLILAHSVSPSRDTCASARAASAAQRRERRERTSHTGGAPLPPPESRGMAPAATPGAKPTQDRRRDSNATKRTPRPGTDKRSARDLVPTLHPLALSRAPLARNNHNPAKAMQLCRGGVTEAEPTATPCTSPPRAPSSRRRRGGAPPPRPGPARPGSHRPERTPRHGTAPPGPNTLRKRLRKELIGQTGAVGPGRSPSTQPHSAAGAITAGSRAMIEIGTS